MLPALDPSVPPLRESYAYIMRYACRQQDLPGMADPASRVKRRKRMVKMLRELSATRGTKDVQVIMSGNCCKNGSHVATARLIAQR